MSCMTNEWCKNFITLKNYNPMDIFQIPSYKRISFTNYVVDCFYIDIKNASHYFLSHFHSDHYYGLKKSFSYPIYCSITTANLIELKYKCKTMPLENNKNYCLEDGNIVSLIDAHHCPGAVCFIFYVNGAFVLHTGDFRCTYDFTLQLMKYKFTTIFLDNTFEGKKPFPSQEDVIHRVLDIMRNNKNKNCLVPINYKYLFCTYMIGKEKIFLCAAEFFDMSIKIEPDKFKVYKCYDQYAIDLLNTEVRNIVNNYREKIKNLKEKSTNITQIKRTIIPKVEKKLSVDRKKKKINPGSILKFCKSKNVLNDKTNLGDIKKEAQTKNNNSNTYCGNLPWSRLTTETKENQLLVISTQHIEKKRLHKILDNVKADRVTVFCGTGWHDKTVSFDWCKSDGRKTKKGVEIIHVPYSEHSSSAELDYFKKHMNYDLIINTVKNKSRNDRDI